MKKASVVWAIDPFDSETGPSSAFAKRFLIWLASCQIELQPVYVLTNPKIGADSCEIEVAKYFHKLDLIENSRTVKLLPNDSTSRSKAVQLLVDFAEHEQSLWTITSSHGREGAERLIFGSFAEQLLIQSKCPILFLPQGKQNDGEKAVFEKVLFSTDFSENSKSAFQRFLQQAKAFQIEITLFHSVSLPLVEAAGYGMPVLMPENYIEEQESWAREEGARWILDAKACGVKCKLALYNGEAHFQVGKSILEFAEKNNLGMIVLTSPTGPITAFLAGSVAREVFRAKRLPVLVFGPNSI